MALDGERYRGKVRGEGAILPERRGMALEAFPGEWLGWEVRVAGVRVAER